MTMMSRGNKINDLSCMCYFKYVRFFLSGFITEKINKC